jgi:4-aminobutyrate aminotransferase-like enzyme
MDIAPNAERLLAQSYCAPFLALAVREAEGCRLTLEDGRTLLDFNAMAGTVLAGYNNERIRKRIVDAFDSSYQVLAPISPSPEALELAERLIGLAPGDHPKNVWFGTSGGSALDVLVRLLPSTAARQYIVAFEGAHHGFTSGAQALSLDRLGAMPPAPFIAHAPYPYPYRCPWGPCDPEGCSLACLTFLDEHVLQLVAGRNRTAAVIIEPIQSPSGEIVPPDNYLPALRTLCSEYGIWLVADEVKTGLGRTGQFLALEHLDVTPDAVVLGKGLAGGLPLSAIVARVPMMDDQFAAETLSATKPACAGALAILDVIAEMGLVRRAAVLGSEIRTHLRSLVTAHPLVGEVRGRGLLIGMEFVRGRSSREPNPEAARACRDLCFDAGLLVKLGGLYGNVIGLSPPLAVTDADATEALNVLAAALARTT